MFRDIITRKNYTAPPLSGPSDITNHTTVASKILDTEGARGAAITVFTAAVTGDDGTANTCTVHLQESDTIVGTDFADVDMKSVTRFSSTQATDATPLQGAVEAGIAAWPVLTGNGVVRLGYLGQKRYIRANYVFLGTGITHLNQVALGQLEFAELLPHADISPITAT